jgi:hypothetical protein
VPSVSAAKIASVIKGMSRDMAWQGCRISCDIEAKSRSEKKENGELRVGLRFAHQEGM